MEKKYPPQVFVGILAGKKFRRGDGFEELKPDGEFPVAIPTLRYTNMLARGSWVDMTRQV
jgi:hypothetical protein